MMRRLIVMLIALCCVHVACAESRLPEHISHGRFKDVALYRPAGPTRQFVLLLSGNDGFTRRMDAAARALVGEGAMVAGVDTVQLRAALSTDPGSCVFPDGDLENLSHYLQGYARVPGYLPPILVGEGEGGALAYALLAKSTPDIFPAAISLDFCPQLDLGKPQCADRSLRFAPHGAGTGVTLLPGKLGAPWVVIQGGDSRSCTVDAVSDFVAHVPGGALVRIPEMTGERALPRSLPRLLASYRSLASIPRVAPSPPASLADLPLIVVPTRGRGDSFAILLSGDGGWAGLDKHVAEALAQQGIPVVGFDSLQYFWRKRTPASLAVDLDRVIRYYAARWNKTHVRLIGYSQGADVLPFAINRLPAASRAMVLQNVLIGLGDKASFEFHLSNWMSDDDDGLPILPEVSRLDEPTTLCLYGDDEKESLCPKVPPGHVTARMLPGGHHFDGAYARLAAIILASRPAP